MSVKRVVNGRLVRGTSFERVSGAQEIAQGVDTRLQTLRGERPWDLEGVGTGWLQVDPSDPTAGIEILAKGVPEALILGEIERRILSQPGMLTVDELDATQTSPRSIRVDWAGTASIDQLGAVLRLQGTTEITTT